MKSIVCFLISIIFIGALFSGCYTQKLTNRPEETKTFAIDFRKYANKGFLFMPDKYFGEYEVKGIIRAELHPKVSYVSADVPLYYMEGHKTNHFYAGDKKIVQVIKDVNLDELIEHIYNLAIEWGGDAFSHFVSTIEVGNTDDTPYTTYSYYTISGIVIKRK